MSLRIRLLKLKRHGQNLYRVIVSEKNGKVLDSIGYYQPKCGIKGSNLQEDKIKSWVEKGAVVLPSVKKILALHK